MTSLSLIVGPAALTTILIVTDSFGFVAAIIPILVNLCLRHGLATDRVACLCRHEVFPWKGMELV